MYLIYEFIIEFKFDLSGDNMSKFNVICNGKFHGIETHREYYFRRG